MTDTSRRTDLPLLLALLPLAVLLATIAGGVALSGFGGEILIVAMALAALCAGLIARSRGAGWADIQAAAGAKIADVLPAILILLSIGVLLGAWMFSGTIPLMVVTGIALIDPGYIVLTAFIGTALMSIMTGTSWGSAGTLGVAFIATAEAMGLPLAPVAGAVVSGAYFGDKLSPLSDTTNVAAIAAHVPVFSHIRHMLWTAVPSFILAGLVYALAGLFGSGGDAATPQTAQATSAALAGLFRLDALALLPVALAVGGIALRQPPALVILASSALALVLGVAAQGWAAGDAVRVVMGGFDVSMTGTAPDTLPAALPGLLNRGGLASMGQTLIFIITAFVLAGAMETSGALARLMQALLGAVRSTFSLVAATLAAGATFVAITSHAGVTALIVGELFRPAYRDRGLAGENLSRSIEDSVTLVEPLLPWTVSALFMATTLGVPTLAYAPWALFCLGGPVFSLLIAALAGRTGWGIRSRPGTAPQ
ncbi:Na+/H+ antiporter NhaC [Maricaulis sp.]|uniref:Na+/H+ antiporter NhaC n=1 Tax=Maricaulis sp. TaxID=1486257 RepID=UPI001B0833DC|nr:Na+/H+ antiporter NhaC [Maricaulis sp.]MBO6764967.1 Na+/H+ antiporter NhaC [Maricaulis sp.]